LHSINHKKKQPDTARRYDKLSRYYDLIAGFFERRYIRKGLHLLNAKPSENILEIGFGTGYAITQIAEAAGPKGKVYGIDISKGMYRITEKKLKKRNLLNSVILRNEDILKSRLSNNFFDGIFTSFTLEIFNDNHIESVLKKAYHALKKNGRICVVCVSSSKKEKIPMRIYRFIHNRLPNFIDCRPVDIQKFIKKARFHIVANNFFSIAGITAAAILAKK